MLTGSCTGQLLANVILSSVFVWIGESEPDTSHRIRVDANIKYAVPAYRDSCGRFEEDVNKRQSLFFLSVTVAKSLLFLLRWRIWLLARGTGKMTAPKRSSFGTRLLLNFLPKHFKFWNLQLMKITTSAKFPWKVEVAAKI